MEPIALAQLVAQAALDKKATRLVLQDLRGKSDLCQYQLICSGSNERQAQAICTGIEEQLRRHSIRPMAVEGKQTGVWVLVDYGSLLVHIFQDVVRDHYALEGLFAGAKFVDLGLSATPPATPPPQS